jgi:hypothetical protein
MAAMGQNRPSSYLYDTSALPPLPELQPPAADVSGVPRADLVSRGLGSSASVPFLGERSMLLWSLGGPRAHEGSNADR